MLNNDNLKKLFGTLKSFEHNRVTLADHKYIEFADESGNCMSHSMFGSTFNNLFSDLDWLPRIGESVKADSGEIYQVTDILLYRSEFKRIKRFYLKKKTEQKKIVDV